MSLFHLKDIEKLGAYKVVSSFDEAKKFIGGGFTFPWIDKWNTRKTMMDLFAKGHEAHVLVFDEDDIVEDLMSDSTNEGEDLIREFENTLDEIFDELNADRVYTSVIPTEDDLGLDPNTNVYIYMSNKPKTPIKKENRMLPKQQIKSLAESVEEVVAENTGKLNARFKESTDKNAYLVLKEIQKTIQRHSPVLRADTIEENSDELSVEALSGKYKLKITKA